MLTNLTLFKTITFVSLLSILTACNSDLEDKVDGIAVSAQAEDVLEGNEGFQDAHFTVTLSKAASAPLSIEWELEDSDSNYFYDQGWQAENVEGRLTFEVGEIEKTIPLQILGDKRIELNEHVYLHLNLSEEYTGSEVIHVDAINTLFVRNDDIAVFQAGNYHAIYFMYTADRYSDQSDFDIANVPGWLEIATLFSGGDSYLLSMEGEPSLAHINTTGTVELTIHQHNYTINYRVTEGDQDNDGVIDSEDAFPTNPRGITDSDNDGVGDEWELTYFEDLTAVTDQTDYDQNGLTDWYAFENGTPVNDLSVDFESGQLPVGWSNSGHVNWVISDSVDSTYGAYSLATEAPLAPGERAIISFSVTTQSGYLELSTFVEAEDDSVILIRNHKDEVLRRIKPTDDWQSSRIDLSAGTHHLSIEYTSPYRDYNEDAYPVVYLDNLQGLIGLTPADRDGDQVNNRDDLFPDRADAATDSDNDGIGDEWENRFFYELTDADGHSDFDKDGVLDIDEFLGMTRPDTDDTDYDGMPDNTDAFATDRRYQQDQDADGLADAWEMLHFSDLDTTDGQQDSDGDGIIDADEFIVNSMPAVDTDNDGVADVSDAFPEDFRFQSDTDQDGIADAWEYRFFGWPDYVDQDDDYDQDGYTAYQEFLTGMNPRVFNLNAHDDIIQVTRGQTIHFDPRDNDRSLYETLTVTAIDLPEAGSLQTNPDGSYRYTANADRLGWIRLNYSVEDDQAADTAAIFIHLTDSDPAKLVRIDSSDHYSQRYSLAVYDNGYLYAWGDNADDQLGLDQVSASIPTRVKGLPAIKDFAFGWELTLALAENGSVWVWGDAVDSQFPQQITGLSSIKAITAYNSWNEDIFIVTDDGAVWTAQSFSGLTESSFSRIDNLTDIVSIKAGEAHLLALTAQGDVWAYGDNDAGQLGNVDNTDNTAMPVSKLNNIVNIEAAGDSSFAINDAGELYAWGDNEYRQLGDGTRTNRTVPVLIDEIAEAVEVKASEGYTVVRTEDGQVFGMGYNNYILEGYAVQPQPLLGDQRFSAIGAGDDQTFFIDQQGDAFGVGSNGYGQLGDSTTESRYELTAISWLLDGAITEPGKEGFEWGFIPPFWRNSGANWVMDTSSPFTGQYATTVDQQLDDYGSASLALQATTVAGEVTFAVKTSTEADFDVLLFFIDGVEKARYSGEQDWVTSASFTVTPGPHSFEWVYSKDGGTSVGEDTVWLDDIRLPIDSDGDGITDDVDPDHYHAEPVETP